MREPRSSAVFFQFALLTVASAILLIGLLMIFSTTSAGILDHDLDKNTRQPFLKQIYYGLAGLLLSVALFKIGYKKLLSSAPYLLAFFTFLLILTLIPGIGKEVNGSKRWLSLLGFSFQPSEFVKYLVPAFFIERYVKCREQSFLFVDFLKLIGWAFIPMVLILVEPNNGTTAVIGVTLLVLVLLMGVPIKYWGLSLLSLALISGIFALQLPYVSSRINVYLHPEIDLKGKGHQPYQAKIAAGSGGVFGKGPGNSLQKLSYLPEAQNDYIAAIYAEEIGFVGILSLIILYMLLAFFGFSIAFLSTEIQGFYLAASIVFLISLQAFLNLGVVSGLLPSTGLNLPFFSQGGTSLMANMVGISVLLSIAKRD